MGIPCSRCSRQITICHCGKSQRSLRQILLIPLNTQLSLDPPAGRIAGTKYANTYQAINITIFVILFTCKIEDSTVKCCHSSNANFYRS